MSAVRVLFWVFWFVVACCYWVFGGGVVGSGTGRRDSRSNYSGDGNRVIEIARKEIGVREVGENAGERVDEYCAYVGVKEVAWCAAFVSWCFGQAGYGKPRTAWSPALFPTERSVEIAKARAELFCFAAPSGSVSRSAFRNDAVGLIIGIYFPSMGRIAHCGIVESVKGDFVISIEGNTSISGSREGDGVYRRARHRRTISKYANWF